MDNQKGLMYSCGKFWFLESPELIRPDIREIARSLSRICRWNGNAERPIYVAEHSVNVARLVAFMGGDDRAQCVGLLHDVHEAFVGDISAPLRERLWVEFSKPRSIGWADNLWHHLMRVMFDPTNPPERCDRFVLSFEDYEKKIQQPLLDKLLPGGFDEAAKEALDGIVARADILIRRLEIPKLYGGRTYFAVGLNGKRPVKTFRLIALSTHEEAEKLFLDWYESFCDGI